MNETDAAPIVAEVELQNIRRIFRQFDKDQSNTIDVDELKEVMASLGVLMDDQHLQELVEQVTVDGKSELNFEEFLSLITLWKEASQYKLFDGKGFKSLAQQHVEKALQAESLVGDHPWRAACDVMICFGALTYWIFVLSLDAYGFESFSNTGLIVGDVFLTVVFLVDAALCSRTCFVDDGRLQDNPREVLHHYARTWMVPDLLASIPFDLILTASGKPTAATVLRHLRLLKLLKIPFLWQPSGCVPITSNHIRFHFHMLPIFQLVLIFVIMVHGFAIGWIFIKQSTCNDVLIGKGCEYPYTPAVYFVLYTLSTVGLGDVPVVGDNEQWYACFVLCGAMATNGIVIGKLVAILQRADIKKERRAKLRETLAVLDHFSIPKQLQEEILQFQAHVFEHNLGAAYEGLVSGLPAEMRTNINLFVKMKLVTNVPMFVESHHMLRIAVAQCLENAVARPEQYIIVCGQESDGLYLLAYGFADVFTLDGSYDGTLRSGEFFGDGALLGEASQSMSVKAITYCDLWVLSNIQFAYILKRFPKFQRKIAQLKVTNPLSRRPSEGDEEAMTAGANLAQNPLDEDEEPESPTKPSQPQPTLIAKANSLQPLPHQVEVRKSEDEAHGARQGLNMSRTPGKMGNHDHSPPDEVKANTNTMFQPQLIRPNAMEQSLRRNQSVSAAAGAAAGAGGGGGSQSKQIARLKTILQTVQANRARLQRALKDQQHQPPPDTQYSI